jgi:hypothetical protein
MSQFPDDDPRVQRDHLADQTEGGWRATIAWLRPED